MTDLHLPLDPALGRRAGLEHALRRAIVDGRLAAGARVPPTRRLAQDLGWARATVVAAYEQLVDEGYLQSRRGAGTRVAEVVRPGTVPPTPTTVGGGSRQPGPVRYRHDFRPGAPDVSQFPRAAWLRSVRRVLAEAEDDAFDYGDPRGHHRLRLALANHLARSRAVDAPPGALRLYGGFFAALGFVAEVLIELGVRRIAVEDPMLFVARDVLTGAGLEPVPIPVDNEGIDVDALDRSSVGAVVVTPGHQFPLGTTMSAERRTALVEWARSRGSFIIEDDYDGEFRYDRQPVGAVQGLAPDRVVYAGTTSKTLAPGLRLAWLAVPDELRRPLAVRTQLRAGVSSIEQLTLADFIERGELDRHVRRIRGLQQDRHRQLTEALAAEVPWLVPRSTVAAGLHVTVTLPAPETGMGGESGPEIERRLVEEAASAEIGLLGLGRHWLGPPRDHGLVLGYSRPPQHGFAHSLDRLIDHLRHHQPPTC